jgi:hypothetical protein
VQLKQSRLLLQTSLKGKSFSDFRYVEKEKKKAAVCPIAVAAARIRIIIL